MPEFAQAAREIYDAQLDHDSDLKQTVISTIRAHADTLFDKDQETESEDLIAVLEETQLGADVSRALAQKHEGSPSTTHKCPRCNRVFTVAVPQGCNFSCPQGCYNQDTTWWAGHMVKPGGKN